MDSWIAYLLIVMVAGLFGVIGWLVWRLAPTRHADSPLSGVERVTVEVLLQQQSYTNDRLGLVATVRPGEDWQTVAADLRRKADRLIRERWEEREADRRREQLAEQALYDAKRREEKARQAADLAEQKARRDAHVAAALAARRTPCPDCPAGYCSDCPCPDERRDTFGATTIEPTGPGVAADDDDDGIPF